MKMGVFLENAGFVFFENGRFFKKWEIFLKIRVFLDNGCVFRKCGVLFSKWEF